MLSGDPGTTGDPLRIERRSLSRCDRGWHHKFGDARIFPTSTANAMIEAFLAQSCHTHLSTVCALLTIPAGAR